MNNPRDIFSSFSRKKPEKQPERQVLENPWLMVREWYKTELGQALLEMEKYGLGSLLEHIFGYNLVQLGCLDEHPLIDQSRTSYQYTLESVSSRHQACQYTHIITSFSELPISNYSIDAVVLPHTLEFEREPHQILREVERILVAEGKAIFLGFNPVSLLGMWHKYWEMKNRIASNNKVLRMPLPSCGQLISQKRLRDWLQLLGFDIEVMNEYFYRPPFKNATLLKKLEFIERAGQFSRILPAGAYLMVATKRVSTLTPVRQKWKLSNTIIGSETAEPAGFKQG